MRNGTGMLFFLPKIKQFFLYGKLYLIFTFSWEIACFNVSFFSFAQHWNLDTPLSASFEDMMQLEHKDCLCLETYGRNV